MTRTSLQTINHILWRYDDPIDEGVDICADTKMILLTDVLPYTVTLRWSYWHIHVLWCSDDHINGCGDIFCDSMMNILTDVLTCCDANIILLTDVLTYVVTLRLSYWRLCWHILWRWDDPIDGCVDICCDAKIILLTDVLTYAVTLRWFYWWMCWHIYVLWFDKDGLQHNLMSVILFSAWIQMKHYLLIWC